MKNKLSNKFTNFFINLAEQSLSAETTFNFRKLTLSL